MNSPIILRSDCSINGCKYLHDFKFECGHSVPIYDLTDTNAFNQLIGYAKYINKGFGNVYYRGIDNLYPNVRPSIMRKRVRGEANDLNGLITKIKNDEYLALSLKLLPTINPQSIDDNKNNKRIRRINKYVIEGMLQHYCGITRFIDVVDNHWIALWMGLHDFIPKGEGGKYISCVKRELSIGNLLNSLTRYGHNTSAGEKLVELNSYVYILLLGMPYSNESQIMGVSETDDFVEVDLRKALPSFYLRPHAQHALVIRKRDNGEKSHDANYYDMARQTIGILRIRIDIADKWLGDGELVSKDNLFPSPSLDQGYNGLLKNSIFTNLKHPKIRILKYF